MPEPIKLLYVPRRWATPFHATIRRWIVLVVCRRAGKTTAAINHLQRDALKYPNTRYAYIAPTFKQAKRIVWKMAKLYTQGIHGVKFNESELLITYENGSEIMILGSDQPDSLRGIALWGCFLDEYPLQSPIVFTEIVTKCLADHIGYCIFGGTPKGKGHFYDIHQVALKHPDEYYLVYKTVDDLLKEESGDTIDALRQALEDDKKLVEYGIMTKAEFEQEWYNSFEAAIKGAVYLNEISRARERKHITDVPHDPDLPVHTVWDLGIGKSDAMAVGFYQKPEGGRLHMIDYYENTGLGLSHYIGMLDEKKKMLQYKYGKHFAPHDIAHRDLISGKTRLERAEKLGIEFEVIPRMDLEDGIDLARSLFNRTYFDKTRCEIFLDFIGQYHYESDEKRRILTRKPVHDFTSHAADQFRYAAIVEDEMLMLPSAPTPQAPRMDLDDEFVGQLGDDEDEVEVGMGKHPMLRGVNIGALGHKRAGDK